MQNDDKRASRDDETLPGDAEAEAAFDSEHDADSPEDAEQSAFHTAGTTPFPKTSRSSRTELEPNFGMPDFDFPAEKPREEDDSEEAGHAMMAAKETLDLPLGEGTGWDSVTSIERPSSLQGRLRRDPFSARSEGDVLPAPPRAEANVMPFPGAGFPRSSDPTPVDMLRNSAADDEPLEDFAAPAEEPADPVPDYDAAAQDTLADAVQSALRNVYGGQVADRSEETVDQGGYTVADTLMSSSSGRERSDPLWPDESRDWQKDVSEDYLDSERETASAEANTEAVLDYLYGQRRSGNNRQEPSLSGESSLRDLSEAAGLHRDWQDDTPDFDDRPASQPSLRDLAGSAYRGSPPRYVEQGDRAFLREQEMGYRGGAPAAEEPEWAQPPYLTHPPAHIAGGSTYPTHLPSASPESLTSGAPDSGHLLGAAGLGLIGGIALAGVLAVFVFNSFVDENDPTLADSTPKVVERLAAPSAETAPEPAPRIETPPVRVETPAPVRSAVQTPPVTAPEQVEQAAPPARIAQPEIPGQKLYAQNVIGDSDNPIRLDIKVAEASDREDSLISLKGLPPEAKLSTGIDVGGGQWLLPPARLKDLTVTLPKGTNAQFGLEVQLLKDDAQTTLSDPISFDLTVGNISRGGAADSPSSTATAPEPNAPLAVLPDETPQIETDFLTQMLIRDGNRLMRDGDIASARRLYEQAAANGNPEAALAMGRSFDPSYFEKLPVKTGKPDPATAFEWYKKALEGGLVTARVKIDALKQWLQR